MNLRVSLLLLSVPVIQGPALGDLDFAGGSLKGWTGEGFYLTTGKSHGPSRFFGVCSSDRGTPGVTGILERRFTVPQDAGVLLFRAYASMPPKDSEHPALDIRLETPDQITLPKRVWLSGKWQETALILPPEGANPRQYLWDLTAYRGTEMRLVLVDDDRRPGAHLYAAGFRIQAGHPEVDPEDFGAFMVGLEKKHKLSPMARFDSKHFTALSNADDDFSKMFLRSGEQLYDQFMDHFRRKGFALTPPRDKLMMAVFDTEVGFEAYFGRKIPAGVGGVYDRSSNRLVVYDYGSNLAFLEQKKQSQLNGKALQSPAERQRYLAEVSRRAKEYRADANVGTIMHELGHQMSFNTGLLNRAGDVPIWLAEGVACYCESTERGDWLGIGESNGERLQTLMTTLKTGQKLLPLQELIVSEAWANGPTLLGYAQSWALFKYLMDERAQGLNAYLALIADRKNTKHRLKDFNQAFGDLPAFEEGYQEFVASQIKLHFRSRK